VTAVAAGLRSARERVIQTLWFEGLGLVLVAPLYAWAADAGTGESFAMVAAVSVVVMVWAALYNTAFDVAERSLTGRVASDRPHRLRTLHAIGLEASAVVVSCPVIWAMTDLGWLGALLADLGLTVSYAVYGYLFHLGFDRLRPVAGAVQGMDRRHPAPPQ
jgi:uncharacterized membrane protein